jgi:hypothetical protein
LSLLMSLMSLPSAKRKLETISTAQIQLSIGPH